MAKYTGGPPSQSIPSNQSNDNSTVKAGNYAIATAKTRPWLSTPIVTTTAKSRRTKAQVQIVYPLFSECAALTTDPFWISIFNNAAKGTFPRGFTYYQDRKDQREESLSGISDVPSGSQILTYKRGVKTFSTDVPSNPADAIVVCISFFARTAGIMSESDQERTKREYDQRMLEQTSIRTCTWADIKKKKIRDILIGTFVQKIGQVFELTDKESDQLSTMISIGFLLGYFQSKNVVFDQGRIKAIVGLLFDPETRVFFLDSSLSPKITKTSKTSKTGKHEGEEGEHAPRDSVSFISLWSKFLDNMETLSRKNESGLRNTPSFGTPSKTPRGVAPSRAQTPLGSSQSVAPTPRGPGRASPPLVHSPSILTAQNWLRENNLVIPPSIPIIAVPIEPSPIQRSGVRPPRLTIDR